MLDPLYGRLDKEVLRIMMNKEAIDDEVNQLIEIKRTHYLKIAQDIIKILPCARELITVLKDKGIKIAIATSGQRSATEIALDKLNIRHLIDAVITGTEVKKGKPDPEIFLRASEMLKTRPPQCIVVEDAVHGIIAAKKAGMKSIAVSTGKTSREELNKHFPTYSMNTLCELMPKLEKIIER